MREAKPQDDEANRADLVEAIAALGDAEKALRWFIAAENGKSALNGPHMRDRFVDRTGVALSRLLKIWSRVGDGERP